MKDTMPNNIDSILMKLYGRITPSQKTGYDFDIDIEDWYSYSEYIFDKKN